MSIPRYASLAGRLLARTRVPVPATPPAARAAAVEAVAIAIRARARRQRLRRWTAAIGMVAACALALGGLRHVAPVSRLASGPSVATAAQGSMRIVAHPVQATATLSSLPPSGADGWTVSAGSRVFSPLDGRIALSLSTGTSVLLHEASDLTVVGTGAVQVFRVDAGSVDFHVAKLSAGERFLVDTLDAEVEVRGTRFRVSIAPEPCADGTLTRVAVTEGVVAVRRAGGEVRVRAGEHWPVDCDRSALPAVAVSSLPYAAASAPSASTLAQQNALFAAAVAARRRGDMRGALAALDGLLAKYPSSPLEESACAERLRVLAAAGSARADTAARDYLARYPTGFARAEAEAVLGEGR